MTWFSLQTYQVRQLWALRDHMIYNLVYQLTETPRGIERPYDMVYQLTNCNTSRHRHWEATRHIIWSTSLPTEPPQPYDIWFVLPAYQVRHPKTLWDHMTWFCPPTYQVRHFQALWDYLMCHLVYLFTKSNTSMQLWDNLISFSLSTYQVRHLQAARYHLTYH